MPAGKYLVLTSDILAVEIVNGKRTLLRVAKGSKIEVLSGPTDPNSLVTVTWNGRTLTMFSVDVQSRCNQIYKASGSA